MAGFIPYRRSLKPRARGLRREATLAERKLWYEFLRELNVKFTRQKPLRHYIADFYCSKHQRVIEVDGDSHFQDGGSQYDANRTAALANERIRVLRFTNLEVMEQFEGVCCRIGDALRHGQKT